MIGQQEGRAPHYKPGEIDNSYYGTVMKPFEIKVRNECVSAKNQKELLSIWSKYLFPERYYDSNGNRFPKLDDYQRKIMLRTLCKCDRLFLMLFIEGHEFYIRLMFVNNWLFTRTREVQRQPDGHLDLWPRGHYKSTFITKYGIIQELLINPKLSILLITYTKKFANETLIVVRELLEDPKLVSIFNDILCKEPLKELPKGAWTSQGLRLKGKTGFHSLATSSVLKNKTGHHANLLIFDDCVVEESVGLKKTRDKTDHGMSNALNMGSPGGEINRRQYTGTRYHLDDAWGRGIMRGAYIVRKFTATENGKEDGKLVFLDRKTWNEVYMTMTRYSRMCQMFMNPGDVGKESFKTEYLKFYEYLPRNAGNIFIFVDPASTKDINSDYSSISVVMFSENERSFVNQYTIPIVDKYLIDGVRDKIEIGDMIEVLCSMYLKWDSYLTAHGIFGGVNIYYEEYGMQRDRALIQSKFNEYNINCEVRRMGGKTSKIDRINRILPDLKLGRIFLPKFGYVHGSLKEFSIVRNDKLKEYNLYIEDISRDKCVQYFPEYIDTQCLDIEKLASNRFNNNSDLTKLNPLVKLSSYHQNYYDYTYDFISEYQSYPADHDDCLDSFSRYAEIENQEYLARTTMTVHYRS